MVRIRTQREIDLIATSCQIVADTLEMLSELIKPGVQILDLDSKAEDFIISRGARPAFKGYMGYPATLCISVDDAVVHGIPCDDRLKNGQIGYSLSPFSQVLFCEFLRFCKGFWPIYFYAKTETVADNILTACLA